MNATLAAALSYAARNWPVFPVHGIVDGHCTCRDHATCGPRAGKHPRIPDGRNGASVDPNVIRGWWRCWPDANVAIVTGVESGLLVIDLDDPYAVDLADIPETPWATTGRGGQHVLLRRPTDGARWISTTRALGPELAVDSRADGGYIVAAPSLHLSGRRYTWDVAPGDAPLADPPAWWVTAVRREEHAAGPAPAHDPDGELPHDLEAMLLAIPADDYSVWRDVGLALAHADPVGGLAWWDWWSSRSPKYNVSAVRNQWRAMVRRPAVANPVTLHSVRRIAVSLGYADPDLELGAEIAARLLESEQARVASALVVSPVTTVVDRPVELIPPSGMLAELVGWILETSLDPQPELAVAASVAFLGAVMGRKFRTETDLRTNLYVVGVAHSGAGKDHARRCLQRLADAADLGRFLGGEKIASGSGLISALRRHPAQLFPIDEFGLYLGCLTGQNAAPHLRDLMATLMTLFSSAATTYRGTEYADAEKRPRAELKQPHVCVYGTTTPDQLYAALTSMQGLDGSLARFVIVHAPEEPPQRVRAALVPPPDGLVGALRQLAGPGPSGGNLVGAGGATVDTTDPVTVPMGPGVWDAWEALHVGSRSLASDAAGRAIYARVAENAAKLALVAAVAKNPKVPIIGAEEFTWGREFALWTANRLVAEVARRVSDTRAESDTKRVAELVRTSGPDGLTRTELVRRCFFLRSRDREEVISTLLQAGVIVENRQASTGGRPAVRYVFVGR